ncbi:hypothetical protein NA56DRAFT_734756 [Hyaloscypha hepaticicola]|uniref:Uncharacterized protein n=1 Tax=Hyaloscypha hepaticicola TaxID=2082293 RepID=A0A2J6PLK7_9HELO|nr:hypothetical protein NA56DRAFT_734756 [Hyaloscypha hepaticicola]
MLTLGGNPNGELFDREALREQCGCLIDIRDEERFIINAWGGREGVIFPTVAFAHYTVLEYLTSSRISTGPVTEFFISNESHCMQLFKDILMAAIEVRSDHIVWGIEKKKWWDNFALYSLIVTQRLLCKRPKWFPHRSECLIDQTWRLVADYVLHLVNSEDIFSAFCYGARYHLSELHKSRTSYNISEAWCSGLDNQWTDTDAFRLLILVFMCCYEYPDLVEYYVERCDLTTIFSSHHILSLSLTDDYFYNEAADDQRYEFNCSFIEIFAQLAFYRMEDPRLLLMLGKGVFNPSKVLIAHVGSHYKCEECLSTGEKQGDCIVKRLLERGADPNGTGYFVTPLQIAVFSGQPNVVAQLLATGADPNSTGDADGLKWEGNTILENFSYVHGYGPLDLIESGIQARGIERFDRGQDRTPSRKAKNEHISQLLLQYGARAVRVGEVSAQATHSVSRSKHSSPPPQEEGSENNSMSSEYTSDIIMQDVDIEYNLYSA